VESSQRPDRRDDHARQAPDEEEIRRFTRDIENALDRLIRLKVRLDPKILAGS